MKRNVLSSRDIRDSSGFNGGSGPKIVFLLVLVMVFLSISQTAPAMRPGETCFSSYMTCRAQVEQWRINCIIYCDDHYDNPIALAACYTQCDLSYYAFRTGCNLEYASCIAF